MSREGNMTVERGSVTLQLQGVELLTRYSMGSGEPSTLTLGECKKTCTGAQELDRHYLKEQISSKNLDNLYSKYINNLQIGYLQLCTYLITCVCLSLVIIIAIHTTDDIKWYSTIVISSYVATATFTILLLKSPILKWIVRKYNNWGRNCISLAILTIILSSDVIATSLGSTIQPIRPVFMTTTYIAIYVFLPITNNYIAIISAVIAMTIDAVLVVTLNLRGKENMISQTVAFLLYLISINCIGMHYRFMNEITTRKSFLDRRACIEGMTKLNFERAQEENLLASILPEHLAKRVKEDIRSVIIKLQSDLELVPRKKTSEMYIEEHKNVSILYADVVNYTMITTTLPPVKLVQLLNDLFGKFDDAAQNHDICRIKFLGDCYYCVSGIPDPIHDHALNALEFGFDMLAIINRVRKNMGLDINMRIGLHSGHIIGGLVGIKKWQYDIWSKDVTIANRMETTGKAGQIHITQVTLDNLGENAGDYVVTPNLDTKNDALLSKFNIKSYFLTKPNTVVSVEKIHAGKRFSHKMRYSDEKMFKKFRRKRSTSKGFMKSNIFTHHEVSKMADIQMEKEIDRIAEGYRGLDKTLPKINRWLMLFKSIEQEKMYALKPDPLFKYFIVLSLWTLFLILAILSIGIPNFFERITAHVFVGLFVILLLLQPFAWGKTIWHRFYETTPNNFFIRMFYNASDQMRDDMRIRLLIYCVILCIISMCTFFNVVLSNRFYDEHLADASSNIGLTSPWEITEVWALMFFLCFLYVRVYFLVKWIFGFTLTSLFLGFIWQARNELYDMAPAYHVGKRHKISHATAILLFTFSIFFIDRICEYGSRLDFIWQARLLEEKGEAEILLRVNNLLLENILPPHVASIYLNSNRLSENLYYEKYQCVAVMFASLTNYKFGVDEDDGASDILLLSILDQLISDFDRLLINSGGDLITVEKIKMAGWTYMAACGLDEDMWNRSKNLRASEAGVVLRMVRFAAAMMLQLNIFNKSSFQGFNLRIGISHGEVTAGVVGATKPLYDIWGNDVNMASRMDSTGEVGKIQVTKHTAQVIKRAGFKTRYRGITKVKGAGEVQTFFVPLDEEHKLIPVDNSEDNSTDNSKDKQNERKISTDEKNIGNNKNRQTKRKVVKKLKDLTKANEIICTRL